jgi:hypothetical protein
LFGLTEAAITIAATPDGGVWFIPYSVSSPSNTITKISAEGELEQAIQILPGSGFSTAFLSTLEVDPGDGGVWTTVTQCTADFLNCSGSLRKFGSDGTPQLSIQPPADFGFSLAFPFAITVNPTDGSIWTAVGDCSADFLSCSGSLRKFAPDGTQQLALQILPFPNRLAVNSRDGSVWTTVIECTTDFASCSGSIRKFASDGTKQLVMPVSYIPELVAVDPNDGSLWITTGRQVIKFNDGGLQLLSFTMPSGISGMSLDTSDGSVWVASAGAGTCGTCPNPTVPPGDSVFKLSSSGAKLFSFTFADQFFNNTRVSVVPMAGPARVDTTPPTTTAVSSPAPNGDGLNNTDVTVTLTATDNPSGSGVKEIHYAVGADSHVIPGASAVISLTSDGTFSISYYAVDNVGNQEVPKALTVRIDKTLPPGGGALTPTRSFSTSIPDPDINVNGLALAAGKLFALNTFYDPQRLASNARIHVFDPVTGNLLDSFPQGGLGISAVGLATDGANLYANAEFQILRLATSDGSLLQTITPSGVSITGGAGGLAFLNGELFQVVATVDCAGVSVVRLNAADGTFLGCFNVNNLGIQPRELDADGTNLLYGTWVVDQQTQPFTARWTLFTLSPAGEVLKTDVLFSTQAFSGGDLFALSSLFDVNGLACGNNELYVAERRSQQILVYDFPCAGAPEVPLDSQPPATATVASPEPNANGWNRTDVTVTLSATDNPGGSGVKEIGFSLSGAQGGTGVVSGGTASVTISAEGLTTLTYFARDNAGNQETAKTLTVRIDKTPPTVAFGAAAPTPNAAGWNNTNVSISFTASDSLSGVAATGPGVSPLVLTAEGTAVTGTVTVTDLAGNTSSVTSPAVKIDKTPPTIAGSRSPAANSFGWNKTAVTETFLCADGLSGAAACTPSTIVGTEGTNQSVTGTAVDRAGNAATITVGGINIDKTPPTIAGLPLTGCSLWPPNHRLVQVAVVTASDGLSGLAVGSPSVTGTSNESENGLGDGDTGPDIVISSGTVRLRAERSGNGPGRTYKLTAVAADLAGNAATATATCTVPHDLRK